MINTVDMNDFGQADFEIAFAPLERFPERKYVIRTDTDEAIARARGRRRGPGGVTVRELARSS